MLKCLRSKMNLIFGYQNYLINNKSNFNYKKISHKEDIDNEVDHPELF